RVDRVQLLLFQGPRRVLAHHAPDYFVPHLLAEAPPDDVDRDPARAKTRDLGVTGVLPERLLELLRHLLAGDLHFEPSLAAFQFADDNLHQCGNPRLTVALFLLGKRPGDGTQSVREAVPLLRGESYQDPLAHTTIEDLQRPT